jgi:two-component system nitrogen regulation response regulator GlnG
LLLPSFLPDRRWRADIQEPAGAEEATLDLGAFIRDQLSSELGDLYSQTHDQVDRILFTQVLDRTGGNQREAARLLGISRQTVRNRLRALGMQVTHSVETQDSEPPPPQSSSS